MVSTARVRWNDCPPKRPSPGKPRTSSASPFSSGAHMPNTVYISQVIDASIEKVWDLMRDFNGMPSYHPGIKESVIEGDGPIGRVGWARRFTLAGGLGR